MPRFLLILFFMISLCFSLPAQDIIIKGQVRHANSHEGISKVNIYIEEIKIGTTSDLKGNFNLQVPRSMENLNIIFEHISYFQLRISIKETQTQDKFYLRPRIIQLPGFGIEVEKDKPQILKDIPQPYTIIESKDFETRGFVDAGELDYQDKRTGPFYQSMGLESVLFQRQKHGLVSVFLVSGK